MDDERRSRLLAAQREASAQLAELERQHAEIVAASQDSNADDEHDPEGATIAFERQQVVALRDAALRRQQDVQRALQQDEQSYGRCEACGQPIGAERLEARPSARTCVGCASAPRR